MENINRIDFDYNGKHYCLEYTRESVAQMEAMGFSPSDIDMKPTIRMDQLWSGAFLAHNRNTSENMKKELYEKMKGPALMDALKTMIANHYESLIPEENVGEIQWTVTP